MHMQAVSYEEEKGVIKKLMRWPQLLSRLNRQLNRNMHSFESITMHQIKGINSLYYYQNINMN
jgi:hypothetical protein